MTKPKKEQDVICVFIAIVAFLQFQCHRQKTSFASLKRTMGRSFLVKPIPVKAISRCHLRSVMIFDGDDVALHTNYL